MELDRINKLGSAIETIGEIHSTLRANIAGEEQADGDGRELTDEQKQRKLFVIKTAAERVAQNLLDAPESDKLGAVEENTTDHEKTWIRKIKLPNCTLSLHKMIAFEKEGEMPENPQPSYDVYIGSDEDEPVVDDIHHATPYGSLDAVARASGVSEFIESSLDEQINAAMDSLQSFNEVAEYCEVQSIRAVEAI